MDCHVVLLIECLTFRYLFVTNLNEHIFFSMALLLLEYQR